MKYSKYNLVIKSDDNEGYILFNTLRGDIFIISEEIKKYVDNNVVNYLDKDTYALFKKYGVIINDNVDENRIYEYYFQKTKYNSAVISSTVLLTWACNLKCIYCYEGAGAKTDFMDEKGANQYISFMKQMAYNNAAKHMQVLLFGGEPLLNIKIGFKILNELLTFSNESNIDFSCGVITNGTLLSEQMIKQLEMYNCNMIQITLDGTEKAHDFRRGYKTGKGSFRDIITALQMLNDHADRIRTVIRINVDQNNIEEAYNLLKYIGKSGANLTKCNIDFGIVRGSTEACAAYTGNCFTDIEIAEVLNSLWNRAVDEGFRIYIRPSRKWMFCGLYSENQYTVTPNCDVYKCWEHAGIEQHRMGKIDKHGNFSDLQYAYYDWMSKNPLENEECRECKYLPVCGGGCCVISYNEEKTYHGKGCFKVKGILEKQVIKFAKEIKSKEHKNYN